MAFDSRVAERWVLAATEGEDSLIYLLGVEHLQANKQVKIFHRQHLESRVQKWSFEEFFGDQAVSACSLGPRPAALGQH